MQALILLTLLPALALEAKHGGSDGPLDVTTQASPSAVSSSPVFIPTTGSSFPSSLSSNLPSPTPSLPASPFQFHVPSNATTCQNMTFMWQFLGSEDITMTLTVTNERVTQPTTNDTPLVSRTLSTNVSSDTGSFTWPSVDVVQGWYSAVAFDSANITGIESESAPFFVRNSSDVSSLSCLLAIPSSNASVTTTTASSQTPTSANTPSTDRSTHLSTGALTGTIVGVIVGVVILVVAFSIPRIWRHALPPRPNTRRPGGPYYLF